MAQLRLSYPEFKQRGAEVFQITATPVRQGALYARRFALPFPYLCDEDQEVHRLYGLSTKGVLAAVKAGLESLPGGLVGIIKGEQPSILPYLSRGLNETTMQQAIFLVGKDRRIRFRHIADRHSPLPSNDPLLRALDTLP